MAASDQFRASLPEDAGESDAGSAGSAGSTGGARKDDPADVPDAGAEDTPGGAPPGRGTEAPRRRGSRKGLEDTEALLRRLEQAGFSRAEAARLIFERMRPREEGLVRS
jgi:hypothetical protein